MATKKRFTKALLLRLCAVGLFICLGTFAVIHSIQNQKNKTETQATAKFDEDGEKKTEVGQIPAVDDGENIVKPVSGSNEIKPAVKELANSSPLIRFKPGGQSGKMAGNTGFSMGDSHDSKGKTIPPPLGSQSRFGSASDLLPSQPGRAQTTPPGPPSRNIPPLADREPSSSTIPGFRPSASPNAGGGFKVGGNDRDSGAIKPVLPPARPGTSATKSSLTQVSGMERSPGRSTTRPPTDAMTTSRVPSSPNTTAKRQLAPLRPGPAKSVSNEEFLANSRSDLNRGGGSVPPRTDSQFTRTPAFQNPSPPVTRREPAPVANRPKTSVPVVQNASTSTSPTQNFQSQNPSSRSQSTTGSLTQTPMSRNPPSRQESQLASAPIVTRGAGSRPEVAQATPGARQFEGVQIPALAVQKIAPREIQVNRETTFELIVKNTGKATADNVMVQDFVPEGTRLIETMPPATPRSDGFITWNLGSLSPGQQSSIKMKVLPLRPGNIGSVANVTFGAQASAQTVCTKPELSLRHEAPETVLIGQDLFMNIYVENKGNGAAENVVLQTDVPEGLTFPGGQRELEYSIGTLGPGQTRKVQLPVRAAKVGLVQNLLVAHGEGELRADDSVDIRITSPQLTLRGDGPNRKFLNRKATHTFTIANPGTAAATNMQLVAQLPRGLQFVEANNQGQYDRNSHAVVWRLAKLDPQKTGTVELTTVPVATGQHEITVTAAADLNQHQETKQILAVEQLSELFFDIDDTADAIEVGAGTTYRVRVVNQGQIPASNVQVQVEFAAAIQPLSVDGGVRSQIRGQTVVLDPIPVLQPRQEISFVVNARATQAGEHRTIVSVRSDDRDIAVSKEESTHVYSDR